ncbi:MAG: adenine phosphoribosyltransferase [Gemmatimonadota bacterium]|nr:MAG: adenine phosphoribosyltransferase [Gemmatimonadota bacterium]
MADLTRLRDAIRDVPDFPKPGILFKDITTLLNDAECLRLALDAFEERWKDENLDMIVGIDARGFILGGALADRLDCGFVPVRKKGKLPAETKSAEYALEYGTDVLEIHADAFDRGARVLVIDDLLATGGTAVAAARLVKDIGGVLVGMAFLVNLAFLHGEAKLGDVATQFLVEYE